jgi:hypothetical protein|tara:strand:+ start:2062 stop:2454 length:393 start_codon:yes stop_codon:yes gene_type:complete
MAKDQLPIEEHNEKAPRKRRKTTVKKQTSPTSISESSLKDGPSAFPDAAEINRWLSSIDKKLEKLVIYMGYFVANDMEWQKTQEEAEDIEMEEEVDTEEEVEERIEEKADLAHIRRTFQSLQNKYERPKG